MDKKMLKGILLAVTLTASVFSAANVTYANNNADRGFSFTFASNEAQRTVRFRGGLDLTKRDRSSSYVKNNGNRFYVVDIREDNGTIHGIRRSPEHHKLLSRGYHGFYSVNKELVGKRAAVRLEKGPSGKQWYVNGVFSPDNYQGYTDTFDNMP